MIDPKYVAAFFGFAFVAMWIAVDFGAAVLCLVGAIVFWAIVAYLRGELDLNQLQGRFGRREG